MSRAGKCSDQKVLVVFLALAKAARKSAISDNLALMKSPTQFEYYLDL